MSADRPRDVPGPGVPGPAVPGPDLPGDLLDDIVSGEPGLGNLFGVLTSGPAPAELSGANDALAMFRAHAQPSQPSLPPTIAVPGPLAPEPRAPGPRAPGAHASSPHAPGTRALRTSRTPKDHSVFNARAPRRLAAVTVTLAAAAGLAVAAYTSTLPAPIQHAAYQVLRFAGVPDTRHGAAGTLGAPHRAGGRSAHGATGAHGSAPSAGASPQPGASASPPGAPAGGQPGLSVAASSDRITAGGSDTFTGQLSGSGQAVTGVRLSLQERPAGQLTWHVAGSAVTGSTGGATVTASGLTRNAWFRFAGQSGALSKPVPVIVVPPVSVGVAGGPGGRGDVLTVSSPLASPGDMVVLQARSGQRWRNVAARSLNGSLRVAFMVRTPAKGQQYRAVLLGTVDHGTSVSPTLKVPQR
jgi:hypothetical protein